MITVREIILSDMWSGTYEWGYNGKVHVRGQRKFPERGKVNDFSAWVTYKYIDGLYRKNKGVSISESKRWTVRYQ